MQIAAGPSEGGEFKKDAGPEWGLLAEPRAAHEGSEVQVSKALSTGHQAPHPGKGAGPGERAHGSGSLGKRPGAPDLLVRGRQGQVLAAGATGVTLVVPRLPEEGPPEMSHSRSAPHLPSAAAQGPCPAPRHSLGRTRLCLFSGPPVGLPRSSRWGSAAPARVKLAGLRAGPVMPFPASSARVPRT